MIYKCYAFSIFVITTAIVNGSDNYPRMQWKPKKHAQKLAWRPKKQIPSTPSLDMPELKKEITALTQKFIDNTKPDMVWYQNLKYFRLPYVIVIED